MHILKLHAMKRNLLFIFFLGIGSLFAQNSDNTPGNSFTTIRVFNIEGILVSEINYVNKRPLGEYTYYYDDGNIMEEGEWSHGHQIGILKRYDKNGNICQFFNFDDNGNRVGNQLYYYSSGRIRAEKLLDLENKPVKIIRFNSEGRQKSYITL